MKYIRISVVAALLLAFPGFALAQDAAAPFRGSTPTPTPAEKSAPAPAAKPAEAPAATPQPESTAASAERPVSKTKQDFSPVRAARSRKNAAQVETPAAEVRREKPAQPSKLEKRPKKEKREKRTRADKPRSPFFRRIPADRAEGPRASRPTFDISESSWATAATVKSFEHRWQAAVKKHDVDALDRLIADDFEGTSASGREGSKSTLLSALRRDKNVYKSTRARDMSVRNIGPAAAVVSGTLVESGTTEGGKAFKSSRRFVDTWKLRQGRWQCVASKVSAAPER